MKFIRQIITNWKKQREAEKERRARIQALFEDFVAQTRPLVPPAPKHPQAALFRQVWKRACAYQTIYQEIHKNEEQASLYLEFRTLAAKRYFPEAPQNAYGKVHLKLSPGSHNKLIEQELERLYPRDEPNRKRDVDKACIYVGFDSENSKPYIGQTIGEPEYRWKEHRVCGTGPFKKGASYARWEVIEANVPPNELDELEAYYIGYYNACEDGHNDTKGNNWQSYERGVTDRKKNREIQ